MGGLGTWLLPAAAGLVGLVMLIVPVLLAASTNHREVIQLRDYAVLRQAYCAGTVRMPLQQAASQLAAGRPSRGILEGQAG